MRRRALKRVLDSLPGQDNAVLYLRLNNSLTDETGTDSPTGSNTYTNGIWSGTANEAADFNGAQSIILNDLDAFSFVDGGGDIPFTIFFSLNGDNLGVLKDGIYAKYLLNKRDGSTNEEWQVVSSNSATTYLQISLFSGGTTANSLVARGSTSLSNSTNYFCAITYDGSATISGLKMYVNGTTETITDASTGTYTGMTNGTGIPRIARPSWTASFELDGRMDNICIIKNQALTSSEIEQIRQHIIAGNEYL